MPGANVNDGIVSENGEIRTLSVREGRHTVIDGTVLVFQRDRS